jgi:hypothetical protein
MSFPVAAAAYALTGTDTRLNLRKPFHEAWAAIITPSRSAERSGRGSGVRPGSGDTSQQEKLQRQAVEVK